MKPLEGLSSTTVANGHVRSGKGGEVLAPSGKPYALQSIKRMLRPARYADSTHAGPRPPTAK